ncbi:MAG: response regulator [Candidatus Eisenbacteria bacterium]|nr:response regulator [Candidatus Eisenbacteria bacterium]
MAKARILIIDDNPGFVKMNTVALETAGYEVEAAYNSDEGYTKVEYGRPDAIVLDLMMERHDSGFTLARKLKTHPVYKNIPILMLTAVGEATGFRFSMERDGYWMKTDDFADKPIAADELVRRIESLLAAAGAGRTEAEA